MPGLNAIKNLIGALETTEQNLSGGVYIKEAVTQNQEQIVSKNVGQLYDKGENSLGVGINTFAPYSRYTIYLKTKKGQPTDRVTLRDTGAFHRSFTVVAEQDQFYITATDDKTEELVKKYGPEIFGLTPENRLDISWNLLFPVVSKQVRESIFGHD